MVKNPPAIKAEAKDGFDPWVRKIPGVGDSTSLQYSRLGNSMRRGTWWAIVLGVTESQTQLRD